MPVTRSHTSLLFHPNSLRLVLQTTYLRLTSRAVHRYSLSLAVSVVTIPVKIPSIQALHDWTSPPVQAPSSECYGGSNTQTLADFYIIAAWPMR